jgi:hypothetical protein
MIRRLALALGLSTLLAAPVAAQVPLVDIRIGAQAVLPTGDLADSFAAGFGAYGRVGVPVGPIKLMATLTWQQLKGKEVLGFGTPDLDFIGITAGPHFSPAPLLDIGIEAGQFTEFDKIGIVPSVSLSLVKFDLMGSYTMINSDPKANYLSLGFGIRF